MMNKLISPVKSKLGSHSGMMLFCILLMAGAFWGLAGGQAESPGLGSFAFFLPLAVCLVMCGAMALFMGHGEKDKERRVLRGQGKIHTGNSKTKINHL